MEHLKQRLGEKSFNNRLMRQKRPPKIVVNKRGIHLVLDDIFGARFIARGIFNLLGLSKLGSSNALDYEISHNNVFFSQLPKSFEGFRILHLSDFHIDGLPDHGEKLIQTISDLEYDLCVLTGDFRYLWQSDDNMVFGLMENVIKAIHCPHGILGILGNHDSLNIVSGLEKMGVRMLLNESTIFERDGQTLGIAGVDDEFVFKASDIVKAKAGIIDCDFRILLSHSPELIHKAAAEGFNYYLCGHTHGGQICLPGGFALIKGTSIGREYISGGWGVNDMQGYTTRGTGCSFVPSRFFCRPEVVVHHLKVLNE